MAQQLPPSRVDHRKLQDMLDQARGHKMTQEERFWQEVSMCYGLLPDESQTTKAEIEQACRERHYETFFRAEACQDVAEWLQTCIGPGEGALFAGIIQQLRSGFWEDELQKKREENKS